MELMEALARDACERAGDPSHDFAHIQRVVALARRMGEELGADLSVLIPAAMLHDLVSFPKNHPDRQLAGKKAADKARAVLVERLGIDPAKADRIAIVISEHGFSAGLAPSSLESKILQDSDRLDAIGAIGIARVFACGARMGSSFYHSEDPFARSRPQDDRKFALDHFYVKLLKLEQGFHTEPARREAEKRSRFLRDYVDQLASEIGAGPV